MPHAPPSLDPAVEAAVSAIESEFSIYISHPERVAEACGVLREEAGRAPEPVAPAWLDRLLPLTARRGGAIAAPLFDLLAAWAAAVSDPWRILAAMLASQDADLQRRALRDLAAALRDERMRATPEVLRAVAARLDEDDSPLTDPASLAQVAAILAHGAPRIPVPTPDEACRAFLLADGSAALRRAAARVLDLGGEPAGDAIARGMLGAPAHALLGPYLAFTRATHQDLLDASALARDRAALEAFRAAEAACGAALLQRVVAALGWARCNAGIDVTRVVGLSLGGGFPLLAKSALSRVFDDVPGVRRAFERTLVTAVGRRVRDDEGSGAQARAMARFRAANVRHAEVLTALLDVAPLTYARLDRLLETMAQLVDDFATVFQDVPAARDDIAGARRVHAELCGRIAALRTAGGETVPMDVCRLVLPFEDPASPLQVRTLHGLKRFLHQRGLKLVLSLVGTGGAAMRTVDLAVAVGDEIDVGRHLEFVDLDPQAPAQGGPGALPPAVRLAAEAFGRQFLHRQPVPSHLRVFCYGHEVHYFARFRNHPAFIRIDYSPPLRGGMIDLQYVGVSNYDLDVHPCLTLDAIRHVFERLDFIVTADSTSIHARYDKERAVTLDQLHRRASLLFALVPYLMDLDWTIGTLVLDGDAKHLVARAWAGFFERYGVLPYHQFLTHDRAGVLSGIEPGADREREVRWPGTAPYRDRFTATVDAGLAAEVGARLAALGLATPDALRPADLEGQLRAETAVLAPLEAALARGEIEAGPAGLRRTDAARFRRTHEVERLAALLQAGDADIAEAAGLAMAVPLIERHVRFATTGRVNGCAVQRATLSLGPRALTLAVLRDGSGAPRLACATGDTCFWERRASPDLRWQASPPLTTESVLEDLRAANILGAAPGAPPLEPAALAAEIRQSVARSRPGPVRPSGERERALAGTSASPGRAAGLARLGTAGAGSAGAVVVTGGLDVHEAPALLSAAAIVATGGGILSHLGLLAVESGTPALVVEAAWEDRPNGERVLSFAAQAFTEAAREQAGLQLVERRDLREVRDEIHDGDLVVVDADLGLLTVLGRDPGALTLFECLRQHARASRSLDEAGPNAVLVARGHHLRTRHQLTRALGRTTAPAVLRFAASDILLCPAWLDSAHAVRDGADLLRQMAASPAGGDVVRDEIQGIAARVAARVRDARAQATSLLPHAGTFHDALALRLNVARSAAQLRRLMAQLDACGVGADVIGVGDGADLDELVRRRLREMRDAAAAQVAAPPPVPAPGARRLLEQIALADGVLGLTGRPHDDLDRVRAALDADAGRRIAALSQALIIESGAGGVALAPLIGGKAANLGEIAGVLPADLVPGWFAVTDATFQAALAEPIAGAAGTASPAAPAAAPPRLGAAIAQILADPATTPEAAADAIGRLFAGTTLPPAVSGAVAEAYRALGPGCDVAIRSSAFDEDTAHATRAGLFETRLAVRGEAAVLQQLAQVWAGMWSARALHDRALRRDAGAARGAGVLIQRMVRARIAGVVQTTNVAQARPCELVINVGLGLGEGIVRGAVAADHVVVAKDSVRDAALRFRYVTADKRTRMVADERFGAGTTMVETLAHQRLRPALEYPELVELAAVALRLEQAYAQPLDIEFAFEDADLRILQVRPVPAADAVWRETAEKFPFGAANRRVEERR